MIPDITELNFPKIDGKQYATLTQATANIADMGEKTITTQVKIDGNIVPDFSFDWEVEFQGEKYIMPLRIPQGAKGNDSLNSTIDLTFQHWAIYQLKRWPFVTIQQIAAGTYLPDEEVATVQLNLKDFCILFGQVLEYYYGGAITIDFNDDPVTGWQYKQEATIITISHTKIWNVLIDAFHDKYGVRWEIKPTAENSNTVKGGERYVIRVGYPTTEVDHIFEYGFEGGLLKVERQVQSEEIRNMLKGRGGETNIPFRYFKNTDRNNKDFRPDPDWVEELANIYFPNLMPATFRSYIQGWKAAHINQTDADGKKIYAGYKAVGESNAYAPWAYRKGYTDVKFQPVEFVADEITINPTTGDKRVEILPDYSPYVKKGSSIDKYGPLPDTLDNNDDIYPTLQGTGLDIAVDVEQIESDDVAESTESDAQLIKIPGSSVSSTAVNVAPSSFATIKLPRVNFSVLPGKHGNLIVHVEVLSAVHNGKQIEILNNAEKQGSETINVYNTITGEKRSASGIPEGSYYFEVEVSVHNMTTDKTLNISAGTTTVKLQDATLTDDKWRNTFDIWVKNIWDSTRLSGETDAQYSERVWKPVLGDREGNKAKVVFTSGDLALSEDYEFTIVDFPAPDASKTWKEKDSDGNITATHTSHWRIKLAKSDAELEATGLYVPSKQKQGKAGDTFVFIGTEMTHVPYVVDAEKRLDDWKKDRLGEVNEIKPTAVVTTDRVRLNNEGKPDALINQLRVGNSLRLFDKRFFNEEGKAYETLYLQSITYTYREPSSDDAALNPDVEIVLGNEYVTSANPVSMMQGEISALQRQLGSISNIEQIVRAVGDKLYLRKDGISDRSLSPTQFFSLLTSGDFRAGLVGGAGWGFFKDENGNWVLETDRIKARQDLEVNNLVINQVEGRGGMQVDTAAFMEVTRVAETSDGYVCYFDQKNGTVANLFHVDDVAMSMVFNEEWNTDSALVKTYKRRVVAVAENSVTLSKTESNGSGIPMAGDVIVHYGNYTDATRQYVKVRDVVGGGYERYIEELNSVNADGVEYYFVGRQSGMYNGRPRFYIGDDNGYVEWLNGELNIKGRLSLQSSIGDTNIGTYINKAAQSAADAAKAELQKQIDGVVEAFNGMGAPTLSNHPAIEWTTDAERKRHDKDVYADITPYVDNATTPTSGQSWRWYYNSPTDYGWTKIADSDAVRALQLAHMSVRDTDVLYISHISQTSAPALPALGADGTINDYKGWQTNAPAWSATKYIWQTTYVRRGDGTASFSTPTCISGRNGTDGASVTVTSTEVRYSTVHDSASQPADLTFTLTEVPSLKAGQYLWSRTTVTYSTGGQTQTYAVSRMGCDGASYSANMLLNSMFDSPAHWWFKNASTIDTGRKRDGRNSVKIPATGLTTNYWEGVIQTVECEAGVEVTGSIWSLVEDFSTFDSAFSMELICYDATGNRISGGGKEVSIMPDKAGEWQQFSASMTTVEGTAKVRFYVSVTRNGVAWANSPKLEIGSNPDPVWSPAPSEMLGVTIVSKSVTYAKSSGDIQPDDSAFTYQSIGAAAVRPGEYLWTKTEVVYSDGSGTKAYSVSRIGTDGADGTPGTPGADGRTPYVHYAYAGTPDGITGFSTTYFNGALYVGVCTDYTSADPTDPTKYEWSRLRGDDGSSYTPNLLLKSKEAIENTDNPLAIYELTGEPLKEGDEFTCTIWGQLGAGKSAFRLHNTEAWISPGDFADMGGGVYMLKAKWKIGADSAHPAANTHVQINPIPPNVWVTSRIDRIKLERGYNDHPQWVPAAAEMTAPRITEQYYLSESSTSLTGGAWSDTRQPWEAGRYYWTRSKITYGDGTVEYTDAVCVTGTPGKDALILSLSNEMAGVACDAEGNVTGAYPTSQASVYKGATLLTSGVAYSIPQKTGITTANISASGAVTMSGMTADTAEITVRAVVSGVTLDTVLNLYKVKPGANGQAAVAYSIEPSADKVTRSVTGALSATSVTCSVYKTTGNTARVLSNDHTLTYLRLPDGAGGTLARTNGTSGAVRILADTEAVVFELKDGNTLLDRERVAVFADASDLEVGGRNFARMTANEWTAPASVFNNGINNIALAYHCYGLKSGDLVTVSFDYEASGLTFGSRPLIKMQSGKAYGYAPELLLTASNGRGHAKKTATVGGTSATETSDGEMSFRFDHVTASSEGYFKVWNFKIEKGNIETSWTAAPEDSDYLRNALVQARRSVTEIDGGLILTSLIRLGMFNQSGEGKVMSGISGICDRETSPAIWIGGDMVDRFDNPRGLTPAAGMFRHNGLGYLSNGLIRFLADAIEIGPPGGTREKAIRFDQHGMKMFADSDGSMRMFITNKPLDYDAVDAVQGDVTTIPLPTGRIASMYDIIPPVTAPDGSIRLGSCVIHGYGALTSALGRLPANSEISVPITVNLGYTITTDFIKHIYSGYFRVRIFSSSMVIFDRTAYIDPLRGEGSMTVNVTTPVDGTYTLEVTIGNTLPDYSGMEGNEATVTGIDSGKITKGSVNLIEIGENGILIVRGEMKALFCDNYFGVKVGSNFGIQMTPNSATMRLSGSQWRTLSRASDGTLKLN